MLFLDHQLLLGDQHGFQLWNFNTFHLLFEYESKEEKFLKIFWCHDNPFVVTWSKDSITTINTHSKFFLENSGKIPINFTILANSKHIISVHHRHITEVYVDDDCIITGNSHGLLVLRNITSGQKLYELNCTKDKSKRTSSDPSEKVNRIKRYAKWIFSCQEVLYTNFSLPLINFFFFFYRIMYLMYMI